MFWSFFGGDFEILPVQGSIALVFFENHIVSHTIHGTGIYLPTWIVDFYGKNVG